MPGETAPRLSIVAPMYNEAANVAEFCRRLFAVLAEVPEPWEVVCVDDGSTDRTLELLRAEQRRRPGLRVVRLARNCGQHGAVMAGFAESRGEWVITLDADLQNPPEEIPRLLAAFREGHDLVGTYRVGRRDTRFRKWASRVTNRLITRISGISLRDFGCMLRGYSRRVVDGILRNPEYRTFIPALATFFAANPVEIPVRHEARAGGDSKYSLLKLLGLQLDLMTGFSLWPLRLLFLVGSGLAVAGLAMAALILVLRFVLGAEWAAQGVFTLFAVLFFFVGGQFFALGLLGEYIGRIFQAVRRRPAYLVGEVYEHGDDAP
ncbi:glycosyltransferase [Dissulfurirhabdus thermomarina]|uniref:Glycosyltransferase n=1 Tax=Dissulfurirhabdus thermomarina TaxID=1765737 RepID=A0A6N9TP44_DISTH|nr:glycosyltransferase [Dissulfurirhabdus thermomarina]NDY42939.1 glycosyltransferase [Dissulfurirhabdus thermomarina]NMX22898.1 glycosyltransferase [Dissulfurirhabdus thermomarina]